MVVDGFDGYVMPACGVVEMVEDVGLAQPAEFVSFGKDTQDGAVSIGRVHRGDVVTARGKPVIALVFGV